jgi:hypothetical protein
MPFCGQCQIASNSPHIGYGRDFPHRVLAAFLAISRRFLGDSLLALALPPLLAPN